MAVSLKNMGSRLTACAPALLLLLLAAVVAPALARSTAENRIEEKSARNAEWLRFPTQEMPEIHWGKALTTQYDTSGDSFTEEEWSREGRLEAHNSLLEIQCSYGAVQN